MATPYLYTGNTAPTVRLFFFDTTGAPITTLAFGTAGLTLSYVRDNGANVALTLVTAALGTWVSSGFIARGGGYYDLYLPIAANATGAQLLQIIATALPAGTFMAECILPLTPDDLSVAAPTNASIATAVAPAVRTNLTTELARIDVAVSSVGGSGGATAIAISNQVNSDLAGSVGAAARTAIATAVAAPSAAVIAATVAAPTAAAISSQVNTDLAGTVGNGARTAIASAVAAPTTAAIAAAVAAPSLASIVSGVAAPTAATIDATIAPRFAALPTAAAIATAVAAPTSGQIATAVAAPSAATITSSVSAALAASFTANTPPTVGAVSTQVLSDLAGASGVAARGAIADKVLGRNLKGGSDTGRLVSEALATIRNKVTRSGTTLTVYDQDNVTVLYTAAIVTSAGQLPVSSVTP